MIDIIRLVFIATLLSMSQAPVAQQVSALNDDTKLSSTEEIPEILILPAYKDRAHVVVSRLCGDLTVHAETREELEGRIVNIILRAHNINPDELSESSKQHVVSKFINSNYENLVCDRLPPYYLAQHYFERIIESHLYPPILTLGFLSRRQKYAINVNSVIVDPMTSERRTLLDYVNNIIVREEDNYDRDFDIKELRKLQRILVRKYGAVSIDHVNTDSVR